MMRQERMVLYFVWRDHAYMVGMTVLNLFLLVWALLDTRPDASQTLRIALAGVNVGVGLVYLLLAWLKIRHDYLAEVRRHTARMAEIDQEEQAELKKYADRHRIAQTMDAQQLAALARRNRKEPNA